MAKKKVVYVWTEKTEKISCGDRKAGDIATASGKPLPACKLADSWLKAGWIEEVKNDSNRI